MKAVFLYLSLLLTLVPSAIQSEIMKRHSLESTTVVENPRTDTLYARCPVVRASFWDRQYNDSLSAGRQSTQMALKMDGDQLIYNVLTKNNTGAREEVNKSMGHLVAYVIFMVIGLLLIGVLAPFMICCYCQPSSCPPCTSCRNPEDHEYSTCQKKWPPIVVIVLSFVVLSTMIAVLIVQPGLQKGYSQTRCATAMLFDDLLNGNVSRDSQDHFIGLKPLQVKLNKVSNQINQKIQLITNSNFGSNLLDRIRNHLMKLKQSVSDLPRGDGSNKRVDLTYVSPLNSPPQTTSPHTKQIQSSLAHTLGSVDCHTSLVGSAYGGILKVEHTLSDLSDFQSRLGLQFPKVQNALDSGLQKYASLINAVENMDTKTDITFQKYETQYVRPFSIFVYVIAAIAIAASALLIISTLLVCLKQKMECTKAIFCSCCLLSLIGMLIFVLSLAMSLGTGGTHYGCQYVERGLGTNADFKYRFQPIFENELLTQMMAQCTTQEGKGIIIDQNLINQISTSTKSAHHNLGSIETQNQLMIKQLQQLQKILSLYQHGQVLDIDSPTDIQILRKLSDPASYSCTAPGFTSDSWVPTVNQKAMFIPCKVGKQHLVTKETCPNSQAFETRSGACTGCIDTFSIFSEFSTYNEVLSSLNKRYSLPDCQGFNQDLANVWNNYYQKKTRVIEPIQQRGTAISAKINELNNLIKQLKPNFKSHVHELQTHLQLISQPDKPKKINCNVLGEDFRLMTNTFCRNFFNYAYSMRILSIISGFACLGIMIFGTFFGVRAWKSHEAAQHQEAKSSKSGSHKDQSKPEPEPVAVQANEAQHS